MIRIWLYDLPVPASKWKGDIGLKKTIFPCNPFLSFCFSQLLVIVMAELGQSTERNSDLAEQAGTKRIGHMESNSMNKSDLIARVAEKHQISQKKAEAIVSLFFTRMASTLEQDGRVEIRGFGAFMVKEYPGYTGRNPKTGENIQVHPKRLPIWRTGTDLKNRVDLAPTQIH
jgi:integration host factor subunit beta